MGLELGYERVGVTVSTVADAEKCRAIRKRTVIFGVHLTGISKTEAEKFCEIPDLITACASPHIRELAKEKVLFRI